MNSVPVPLAAPSRPGVAFPTARGRLLWYAATAVVAFLLAVVGHRLDRVALNVPFQYDEDALLILPMVKATLDGGTHWHTPRLGGWAGQDMHDFPVVDHLHFALIWLLGQFVRDPATVFNLYYLLGYPLAAVTMAAVGRHFGLGFPAATCVGVLYAMQPYHLARAENHYFLSAYFLVPVTLAVVLEITRGRLPFFPTPAPPLRFGEGAGGVRSGLPPADALNPSPTPPRGGEGLQRSLRCTDRFTLGCALVAVLTASAGAYYAYFACIFLLAAGLYGWAAGHGWRAVASAGLVIGVVVAAGVLNHAPTFPYQAKYGRHTLPTERGSEDAEYFGLKLAQLVLPIEDHSLRPLAVVRSTYNSYSRPVQWYTERHTLGAVGAVGFVLLLARVFLPGPRTWPFAPLGALTLAGVLVGTVGGVGAVFNHIVTPQVRCYNRIVIYLAVFALLAVAIEGERLMPKFAAWAGRRFGPRAGKWAIPAGWAAVAWFGVWDQTPFNWAGPDAVALVEAHQERYRTDAAFFAQIEEMLLSTDDPDGERPLVFQLPYVKWPESPTIHQLGCYDHARGYVHTRALGWSFGCMKGREVDEWTKRTIALPVEAMLARVVKAGYDGLILDKRGYTPTRAAAVHHQLHKALGFPGTLPHPDGQQIFFDLRPYRDWLRGQLGRGWEAACWAERHPVQILWLSGFVSYRDPGDEAAHRWGGPKALAMFVNPTDEPVTVSANFRALTMTADPAVLHIDGGAIWTESLEIDKNTPTVTRTFVIPPGRHPVRFRCDMPASHVPNDARRLSFYLSGFRID